jgi:nitrite reductase/ring-hydroxylating ferredoxin subunit
VTTVTGTMAFVVAQCSELAESGTVLRRRAGDRDVLLVRAGDTIVATAADCTHACGPLTGPLTNGSPQGLTCTWHGSAFDPRTGAVIKGPARKPLATFEVVVAGDDVMVTIPG